MIAVKLNCRRFEYDIHSLVKAFYPQTEVKVFAEGEKAFCSDGNFPFLSINMTEKEIAAEISDPGGVKALVSDTITVPAEVSYDTGGGRAEYKNLLKLLLYGLLSLLFWQLSRLLYPVVPSLSLNRH